MAGLRYFLGCPVWSNKAWAGEFFTADARPADYLRQYASVFNTVEGNTTFYGLPKRDTVRRWLDETPPHFRFCFKFPREISHHLRLKDAWGETCAFLDALAILEERLGPFFLQLPPSFSGQELPSLEAFLKSLPSQYAYAVEPRHEDFFRAGATEHAFHTLLESLNIGRVIFDTRGLHATERADADATTMDAQRRKPKVPARFVATGRYPFVRFVGHPVIEKNEFHLLQWAQLVERWLAEGKEPFLFMHAPDDFYAPHLARYFHGLVTKLTDTAGTLPPWPIERQNSSDGQLSLF